MKDYTYIILYSLFTIRYHKFITVASKYKLRQTHVDKC